MTPDQRLSWAKAKGVNPPSYAVLGVRAGTCDEITAEISPDFDLNSILNKNQCATNNSGCGEHKRDVKQADNPENYGKHQQAGHLFLSPFHGTESICNIKMLHKMPHKNPDEEKKSEFKAVPEDNPEMAFVDIKQKSPNAFQKVKLSNIYFLLSNGLDRITSMLNWSSSCHDDCHAETKKENESIRSAQNKYVMGIAVAKCRGISWSVSNLPPFTLHDLIVVADLRKENEIHERIVDCLINSIDLEITLPPPRC